MKLSKTISLVLLLAGLCCLSACQSTTRKPPTPAELSEVLQPDYLHLVMRYLYRWQLDQSEFEALLDHGKLVFWIQPLQPKLDPGDNSQFAAILFPQLDLSLRLKKADYRIAETDTPVKSQHFKVTRVTRGKISKLRPQNSIVVTMDTEELRDFLFQTRFQRDTFDPVIVEYLRQAAHEQAVKEGLLDTNAVTAYTINIAPRSPVANETWVFWGIRRQLFYIASDIDIADPTFWKHQTFKFRTFDLNQQVVISNEEATGSNFYLTRNQVSRALFNCMVLGQRIDVLADSATNSAPGSPPK